MAEAISPQLLKVLIDVTGEAKLDSAARIVAQEAIAHRLEHLATQLHALEQKYGVAIEQFHERFQAGQIPNQHSYDVEQDYLEWEGLICRQKRLKEAEDCFVDVTGGLSAPYQRLCSIGYRNRC